MLELGGSDPSSCSAQTTSGRAAKAAGRGWTTPASPTRAKRLIVVDELYDDFVEHFKAVLAASAPGDPASADTAVGPLSSDTAADRLEDQVRRAVDAGAEVVVGGKREGNFFEPTILTGILPGAEASQEEFFGPVAQLYRVSSEDEAVKLANQTPFGLGSYVMTTDAEQGERVADKIEAGMVYVNLVGADSPDCPLAASSVRASAASWAASALTSSSTRS